MEQVFEEVLVFWSSGLLWWYCSTFIAVVQLESSLVMVIRVSYFALCFMIGLCAL